MANRKETPDVLAEILGGGIQAPESPPLQPRPPAKTTRPARSAHPSEPKPSHKASPKGWEYRLVSFQDYRGWRPRYINGQELVDWIHGPLIHEFLNGVGEEGWELVSASAGERCYGLSDLYQLYFKRPK